MMSRYLISIANRASTRLTVATLKLRLPVWRILRLRSTPGRRGIGLLPHSTAARLA